MAGPQLTPNIPRRMRANRKVTDTTCTSCGKGFQIAEEVYACAECAGYHHPACFDAAGMCTRVQPENSVAGPAAVPETDSGAAVIQAPDESIVEPEKTLAEDERRCPSCAEVIRKAAMKCRFCGTLLDDALIRKVEEETLPSDLLEQARTKANSAIWCSIIGVFICAPVLGPIAISSGREALKILDPYPAYPTSIRGRAKFGIVMGWVALVFFVLVVFGNIAS